MTELLLTSALILVAGMALMLVKVLVRRGGRFSSQHISDSKAMRERGIRCVIDQDRQARRAKRKTTI